MKPDLGQPFPPDWPGRPAHMSALDWILWQRFRKTHLLNFSRVYYDVAVGAGSAAAEHAGTAVGEAWQRITRQRVDVVGESVSTWTIIELRAAAGPGALGSILTYAHLWNANPPDIRDVELWLITDIYPDAIAPVLIAHGVTLWLV